MNPVETYIRDLYAIRSSGAAVQETSYYGPLANLLNEVGRTLKPRIRCIMQLRDQGAGIPDGGLFTSDQFPRALAAEPLPGQMPARGAIEVKGTGGGVAGTARSEQVARYLEQYRQVLVTNLYEFVLVERGPSGQPALLESYRLAESEAAFWAAATHPRRLAEEHGQRPVEYLQRVMLHPAPLAAPDEVAWLLASYAREARARVGRASLPALNALRRAMEEALGVHFEHEKGEHFFRSTLVQTLFYGLFSAWVLWHTENPRCTDRFEWRAAEYYLRVPVIQALFEQLSLPSKLKPLGLIEVLDWTGDALNRVERGEFFSRFEEGQAVQYFYEPFLQAYDPELRKELGVWYTPPEIVQYMVARVDAVLRQELGLADGLADPQVYVLDPCCGTGAYLVEVLKRIAATLEEKGEGALVGQSLKAAAMQRVFGFEILPAPFVIAHLQLGLLLQERGAELSYAEVNTAGGVVERAGVYLTNALTGWDLPTANGQERIRQLEIDFPELKRERDAAGRVKREVPILVVLGNPPYNAFAGVSPEEEQGLVEPYKEGLISVWGIRKFNLDDLYVRFFRLAEQRIAEKTGQGVVCYISNFSYLSDPSFVVMRKRFLEEFDALWFDCMNGDSRETGKLTPEGKPDPSIFSTEYNREGIRVGTAIALVVRRSERSLQPAVRFRHFWGVAKRADLVDSLKAKGFDAHYQPADPNPGNRFSFRPAAVAGQYLNWPRLVDLCAAPPSNGLMEKRGGALIDIDRDSLERRMRMYYDPNVDWEALSALGTGLSEDAARFEAKRTRSKVLGAETYDHSRLRPYALRPFETRWCYYSDISPLWNCSRPTLWAQCWEGNAFLMSRPAGVAWPEGVPFFYTHLLGDNDFLRGHACYFPFRLLPSVATNGSGEATQASFLDDVVAPKANLSPAARAYLAFLGLPDPDAGAETAGLVWMHALAIGYSLAYLAENADGLRQDWPRIPLPAGGEALLASAALGRQVAALLDAESPLSGVTAGTLRPELKAIAVPTRVGGGSLGAGEMALSAGWGHAGKGGVTMPGKGKVEQRDYTPGEEAAIAQGTAALGLSPEQARACLGESTLDVYLNEAACWQNVPLRVWEYTIGGYQVIKKWLSYREHGLLGRPLALDEVRQVRDMARRIAALLLLGPALDANYRAVQETAYAWPGE